jgi:hypothetical protein
MCVEWSGKRAICSSFHSQRRPIREFVLKCEPCIPHYGTKLLFFLLLSRRGGWFSHAFESGAPSVWLSFVSWKLARLLNIRPSIEPITLPSTLFRYHLFSWSTRQARRGECLRIVLSSTWDSKDSMFGNDKEHGIPLVVFSISFRTVNFNLIWFFDNLCYEESKTHW